MLSGLAALVYAAVTAGVVAFQIALALGAPWGAYAMGGRVSGRYPPALRVAAVVQALVLALLAGVVLSRAGVLSADVTRAAPWLIWVTVAVGAVALVLNVITPSAVERRIWAPVALVLLISSVTVALTAV